MKKYGLSKKPAFRKRRPVAKRGVSKVLKAYVKRTIHSNIENKKLSYCTINAAIATVTGSTPTTVYLVPDMSVGTGASQRIGNSIKIVRGIIDVKVNLLPYNVTTNPMSSPVYVKMWLCSNKKINGQTLSSTDVGSAFLDINGAPVGLQGNMKDILAPLNSQSWTLYGSKTIKIGMASNSGTVGTANTWFDNSPFTAGCRFNFGKHLKTKLLYNDANTVCQNRNMYLILQAVYADGTNTSVQAAEFHYNVEWQYEDA